jgi:hypothetical protein
MTKLSAAEKISRRNNRTATFPNFNAMPVLPSLRLMPRLTSHKALHCVLEVDLNDEHENGKATIIGNSHMR